MRILLTGGTGFIGSAVARELSGAGYEVLALARSESSEKDLADNGCRPIAGRLETAADWLPPVTEVDAVIHTAATFGPDMADAEEAFLTALTDWSAQWARHRGAALPLVYTGGCWLYGAVGDRMAVEGTAFDPLPAFGYTVAIRDRLLANASLSTRVVHPAMVWDSGAGVIGGFFEAAWEGRAPQVVGSPGTRWPMVHRADLARLYRLVLEQGTGGADYHGVAETGVPVGEIAMAVTTRCQAPAPIVQDVGLAVAELGDWAAGYALDQTMDAPHTRQALAWRPDFTDVIESILHD